MTREKASDENLHDGDKGKKLNQNIELHLVEASWVCLGDTILEILLLLNGCNVANGIEKSFKLGDIRLIIHLPFDLENIGIYEERKRT